jgi:hypothetical protein
MIAMKGTTALLGTLALCAATFVQPARAGVIYGGGSATLSSAELADLPGTFASWYNSGVFASLQSPLSAAFSKYIANKGSTTDGTTLGIDVLAYERRHGSGLYQKYTWGEIIPSPGSRSAVSTPDYLYNIVLDLPIHAPRCLIPGFDGALFSSAWRDALWAKFYTAAPQRQRQSVERYNIVKRA